MIGDGSIDLEDHVFKIALLSAGYTPSAAHAHYADLTNQLPQANGYVTGGITLDGTWTAEDGVGTFSSDPAVWQASGGSITARWAVIYDFTTLDNPLLGYVLLDNTPADVAATSGNTLTVGPNPTQGWFQLVINP